MHPSQIHSYLNSFVNFESQLHRLGPESFELGRIREFLRLAGSPQGGLKIIHVAGTKGKGSTCIFLAGILQEAGYRVGLYTSPHLHKVNERIRILDQGNRRSPEDFAGAISDEALASVLTELQPFADDLQQKGDVLTFFEVLTVAALCYFAQQGVEVVVLETGLGGRLDATNATDSLVAVITPVSLDHTRILGNTIPQIAAEKAGIIKDPRQKVVVAPQEREAMDVIIRRCRQFGIDPVVVQPPSDLKTGLYGRHQSINAATAMAVVGILRSLDFKISDGAVQDGLAHVRWPGRFEWLASQPQVVVDAAHNQASAQVLAAAIREAYPDRRVILVLGTSQDKDIKAIGVALKEAAAFVLLTKAHHPRSHLFTVQEAQDCFGAQPFEIVEDLPQALDKAMQMAGPSDVILVTGSIFIVAEARDFLDNRAKQR